MSSLACVRRGYRAKIGLASSWSAKKTQRRRANVVGSIQRMSSIFSLVRFYFLSWPRHSQTSHLHNGHLAGRPRPRYHPIAPYHPSPLDLSARRVASSAFRPNPYTLRILSIRLCARPFPPLRPHRVYHARTRFSAPQEMRRRPNSPPTR